MFKPKTTISGRLENSSGAWIRTKDLRVMSPTSYRCSTPQQWNGIIPRPSVYCQATLNFSYKSLIFLASPACYDTDTTGKRIPYGVAC